MPDHGCELAGFGYERGSALAHYFASWCQRQWAYTPIEKLHTHSGFEVCHCLRHSRLGQRQLLSGECHRARLANAQESFQGVEIERELIRACRHPPLNKIFLY